MGADLKIRLVFSIPGKPRGGSRIERFFSTVNEMFLCELDGYAPACGVVRGKPTLTLAEFDTLFRAFLLDVYHRRANAETKTPPVARWEGHTLLDADQAQECPRGRKSSGREKVVSRVLGNLCGPLNS